MGPECAILVKHLAKKIAQKYNQDLPDLLNDSSKDRNQICSAKGYSYCHQRNQRQPLSDEDADVDYNVVALYCKEDLLNIP